MPPPAPLCDRDAGNYANISPLMDIAFGTYHCPGHEPESFGIREPISRSYLGQMPIPSARVKNGRRRTLKPNLPPESRKKAAKPFPSPGIRLLPERS